MAHALTHTSTVITNAGGKQTIWDKSSANGNSPQSWIFSTDVEVELYISGSYPGAGHGIVVEAGEEYQFGSTKRGITKIEVEPSGADATITLRPELL